REIRPRLNPLRTKNGKLKTKNFLESAGVLNSDSGLRRDRAAEELGGERRGAEGDAAADQVGQRGLHVKQGRGKDGSEDPREAAETLGDAQVDALFLGGRVEGDQAEHRRAVDA